MAGLRRPALIQSWEEDECLEYYGMFSLHQMFDVIGSQLTENDIEVLSFLLDETYQWRHPLDPSLWVIEEDDELISEERSFRESRVHGELVAAWQRQNHWKGGQGQDTWEDRSLDANYICRPKNGVELLFELERRGKCDETNFRHLLQLLRILSRHDLLLYVSQKRPRTVSPERYTYGPSVLYTEKQMDSCLSSSATETREENWETGSSSNKRKRVTRGRASRSKKRGSRNMDPPKQEQLSHSKVTCGIRLRVRAEYCEHEPVLRQNVLSNKQNALEKQFDVFGQSTTILKSRNLGSIICDIKFSELSYLDAFWNDYMNGSLLEALKGVFITDSLKEAVGQEAIRLLVNVDEDDYEEGRKLLLENIPQ
ncbi:DNA-binding death effector domain-containing protein 2 [Rhinatrema bivittatum]|uniref:DNA-binding death effector domain-containing protein 2 n=1 Tax=Rhinatrema bivittatum TaxID=194408 RepID=UPI00112CC44A|nr:DNA-binding death effector domain-containing protein 2 [Rhinatrema bivittatum]XP_029432358.1 DNA-binding death effector domain-containing protein 2 [Rhinatrema bivittatum]XP_029432359.1 DNA-binding death effector domain-containing protein 2 [Rhinatrema bivittatum]XP_029432360.1 DNA-binding death effector domain-containing protein 2 [Rhinatrema bivittatum]XP_029432361.1 DNA-binding death effector domain-containing protein 2 [Rhinatrema bivittatum]